MRTLSTLLHPIEPALFLRNVWTTRHQYVRGESSKWARFLTNDEFVTLVHKIAHEHPAELGLYSHGVRGTDETAAFIARTIAMEDGDLGSLGEKTLYLRRLSRYHGPLHRLVVGLYNDVHEVAYVNAYLSPPRGEPGLGPHYDAWDVFVLQIAGSKRWELWDGVSAYPVTRCDLARDNLPLGLVAEPVVTGPGDLLYLPRGMWHLATPTDEPSLHLTLGVHCKTGADLLCWLGHDYEWDIGLQRPLSHLESDALVTALAEHGERVSLPLIRNARQRYELDSFVADYAEVFDARRCALYPINKNASPVSVAGVSTCLEQAQLYEWNGTAVTRMIYDVGYVGFNGSIVRLEGTAARIWLRFALPTSVAEATTAIASEVDAPLDQLALDVENFVAQLARRGLLTVCNGEP